MNKEMKASAIKLSVQLLLLCMLHGYSYASSACIIIHGTWAQDEIWHTSRGDFFKVIQCCVQEHRVADVVISFAWSGKLSYASQLEAAKNLQHLIDQYDFVILIGHSHGATVGIIASQRLRQQNIVQTYKIKKFYALGVPVDAKMQIYPDMSVIEKFYNLFSFGDYVQTVNGANLRCFAPHERLANISVMIDEDHPSHGQLHHPIIAKDLLKIEDYFKERALGNFDNFCCHQPGMIQFFEYELSKYFVQNDQKALLELDKKAQWMMTMAFFRSSHEKNKNIKL
jgi:hypothetical protein